MLHVLGSPRRLCDALTRRELLSAGAVGLFGGMTLPNLLRAETITGDTASAAAAPSPRGPARSVILLYLMGGPPHQDMYDMKPDAPPEVRGEFQPIATSVPGIQICELLPMSARWMHRSAIVRSVNHQGGDHNTLPSFTGFNGPSTSGGIVSPGSADPPSMGSVCEYLGMAPRELPAYIHLPCQLGWGQAIRRPGPYGGFLGSRYDPLCTECSPSVAEPAAPYFPQVVRGTPRLPALVPEITLDRLQRRRSLVEQIDRRLRANDHTRGTRLSGTGLSGTGVSPVEALDEHYQRAYNLLTSPRARRAFDLDEEDPKLRDRYGRSLFGESALMGRRLIEAGARFVTVTWDLFWERVRADYDGWDTHGQNFHLLRTFHLPYLDLAYTALLEDLDARGLLDETLVVVMGEMGRTPRINANAGRDHWTHCYSVLFTGAGIQGGAVHGRSDAHAAYPAEDPVGPGDICATIYHCLGIDPERRVNDAAGRPVAIAHGGRAIQSVIA